jgi:hypothetical protein
MKGRKHKATGGSDEPEEDLKDKPEPRTNAKEIDKEAEEKKRGGRTKKARGGGMKHHGGGKEGFGPEHHDEMKVGGKASHHRADRKPRKSGGKAGSDSNPFTSARHGSDAPGRKVMKGEAGFGET